MQTLYITATQNYIESWLGHAVWGNFRQNVNAHEAMIQDFYSMTELNCYDNSSHSLTIGSVDLTKKGCEVSQIYNFFPTFTKFGNLCIINNASKHFAKD